MRRESLAAQLREAVANAPSTQASLAEKQTADSDPQETERLPDGAETETPLQADASPESEQDDGEREVEYFNDLPEVLGVEPEDFYKLKVRLADDQEPVPWGEIKDRLQQANAGAEELARQRETFEQEVAAFRQQAGGFTQQQQQRTERVAKAEGELSRLSALYQAKESEWEQRKAMEPGAVANERQELGMQAAAAQRELEAAQAEQQQQAQQWQAQNLAQQHQLLVKEIPEWADTDKRRKLQSDMVAYVQQRYGVTPQEASRISDARTLLLIKDAMDGVKLREEAKKAVDGIKTNPPPSTRGLRIKGTRQQLKVNVADKVKQAREVKSRRNTTDAVRAIIADAVANR